MPRAWHSSRSRFSQPGGGSMTPPALNSGSVNTAAGSAAGTIALAGSPVGATVHLFRYEPLSELKAGFQIGAVLFLPFMVIDLVVASVTLSIGMIQLPPVMISAPFKILLFVLVDGWNLVLGSLMRSFYT